MADGRLGQVEGVVQVESIAFYSKLFGAEPAKIRPGYANFAIADPPLKLILFWVEGTPDGVPWEIYTVLEDSQTFWGQDSGQGWAAVEASRGERSGSIGYCTGRTVLRDAGARASPRPPTAAAADLGWHMASRSELDPGRRSAGTDLFPAVCPPSGG